MSTKEARRSRAQPDPSARVAPYPLPSARTSTLWGSEATERGSPRSARPGRRHPTRAERQSSGLGASRARGAAGAF